MHSIGVFATTDVVEIPGATTTRLIDGTTGPGATDGTRLIVWNNRADLELAGTDATIGEVALDPIPLTTDFIRPAGRIAIARFLAGIVVSTHLILRTADVATSHAIVRAGVTVGFAAAVVAADEV
jgi:hypothetical protein